MVCIQSHFPEQCQIYAMQVPVGLTGIRIIDFDLVHFVNFEADIRLPEDDSVVQES
jgi:hypothetical protein